MMPQLGRKTVSPSKQDKLNHSLMRATLEGSVVNISKLLAKGADLQSLDGYDLKIAAALGHVAALELLLDRGANLSEHGDSVFFEAVKGGHTEFAVRLLRRGTDINIDVDKSLLQAASQGNRELVEVLLKSGANAHAEESYALRMAAANGHTEIVKLLLEYGTNVHAQDEEALRWAARNGHTETVKALLEYEPDVHARNEEALRWAAASGHTETVKVLLKNGANVHARIEEALRWTAANGHTETVKVLLEYEPDVHARNEEALIWAAAKGHTETVKVLLENGADVHALDGTALRWAKGRGYLQTAAFLTLATKILDAEKDSRRGSLRDLIALCDYNSLDLKSNCYDPKKETYRKSPIVSLALQDAFVAASICDGDIELTEETYSSLFRNTIEHVEQIKGLSYSEYLEQVQAGSAQVAHAKDMFSEVANSYFLPKLLGEGIVEETTSLEELKHAALLQCVETLTQGRTSLDIARLSTSWHKAGNQLPDELVPFRAIGSWYKLFDQPFVASNGLEVHALGSPQDLEFEGTVLDHCVGSGSYASECLAGRKHILSVRRDGIPVGTPELIECEKNQAVLLAGERYFRLGQFQGRSNGPVSTEARAAFAEFLEKSGELPLSTVHGEIKRAKSLNAAVSKLEREIGYPLSEFAQRAPQIEQHYRERVCFHKGHDGKQVVGLFPGEEEGDV